MRASGRQYSLDLRQIDLDINRTFRDNIAYRKRYNQRFVEICFMCYYLLIYFNLQTSSAL
jgi:hypothetical protein